MTEPLVMYRGRVDPAWTDDNGHMNDGYYPVAFGAASWAIQDHLGLHADYRRETSCTLYTVEAHLIYARELLEGQAIHVTTRVTGVDTKRIAVLHEMFATDEGFLAASMEVMMVHYDQGAEKTVPIPEGLCRSIRAIADAHAELGRPKQAGRAVRQIP